MQHHWAHIASVLAETGLAGPVIGVALDGSGYGPDGTIWGGEFLIADGRSFERSASFLPVPLPGGEGAIRHPWRMALSYLRGGRRRRPARPGRGAGARRARRARPLPRPSSRSGRTGRSRPSPPAPGGSSRPRRRSRDSATATRFEGEAAMRLEAAAGGLIGEPYDVRVTGGRSAAARLLARVSRAARRPGARRRRRVRRRPLPRDGRRRGRRAGRAPAPRDRDCGTWRSAAGSSRTGCCSGRSTRGVEALGLQVHTNTRVPANDGGISLGQAYPAPRTSALTVAN